MKFNDSELEGTVLDDEEGKTAYEDALRVIVKISEHPGLFPFRRFWVVKHTVNLFLAVPLIPEIKFLSPNFTHKLGQGTPQSEIRSLLHREF